MRIKALVGLTCVLFSHQGDALGGEEELDCVESCKEGEQERLGDHCYYWSTVRKSWEDSESHCQDEDGHLAAVTSLEIHNFLLQKIDTLYTNTWYWIGGSDKEQEGKWRWTDGNVWNFTNWAEWQPSGRNQDCLRIRNGYRWNDHSCNFLYQFICSWTICSGTDDQALAGSRFSIPGFSGTGFCQIPGSRDFSGRDLPL